MNALDNEEESWTYQADRVIALARAASDSSGTELSGQAQLLMDRRGGSDFSALCKLYRQAALALAHQRAVNEEPAARYDDMEAFFADAADQAVGVSDRSFWDTYENGRRRRLEAQLASAYGCESALLVNSGMSALDCALRGSQAPPNARILMGERQYFESTEYAQTVLGPAGAMLHRHGLGSARLLAAGVEHAKPTQVMLEAFLNGPEVDPPPDFGTVNAGDADFIMDNSVLGHAARWPAPRNGRLLVIESGLKYICQRCSFGVVYGSRERVDAVRLYARRTGVLLQAAALHHLMDFEIAQSARRVRLHGARRKLFRQVLESGLWDWARDCDDAASAADPGVRILLAGSGGGALLFLRAPGDDIDGPRLHREIVKAWRRLGQAAGHEIAVQAGFGWDWISCRAYDGDWLNRKDAGSFIRVSVGLAPPSEIRRSAQLLNEACSLALAQLKGSGSK